MFSTGIQTEFGYKNRFGYEEDSRFTALAISLKKIIPSLPACATRHPKT